MISPAIIIDKSALCDRLVLRDASIYPDDIEDIDISISLEIKAPSSCCFEPISISEGWCSKVIMYDDLNIGCATSSTDCNPDLPDGIYEIKYAINNEEALYYHFRVCKLWNKYLRKFCELRASKCAHNHRKYQDSLLELYKVRNAIHDAVILAEDCLDLDKAIDTYNYAEEKLDDDGCMC